MTLVHRLHNADKNILTAHLLGMDEDGLRCRFLGGCSPEARRDYAERLDLSRVAMMGAFDASENLLGVVEIHPVTAQTAELAISVVRECRGQGIGRLLMDAALVQARCMGICCLEARCLPLNGPMRRLMASRTALTTIVDVDEALSRLEIAA